MTPVRDPRFEATVVKIMAYCKQHGVTAHTSIRGPVLVFRKKVKR